MATRPIKVSERFYSYLKTIMKETGIKHYSEAADVILDRAKDFHSKDFDKQLNEKIERAIKEYFLGSKFKVNVTKDGFVTIEFS